MSAEDFWPDFDKSDVYVLEEDDTSGNGLAADILDYYGIPNTGKSSGKLSGIDIKHMDAISLINLSLLEASANSGGIQEMVVNEDGDVDFITVGGFNGSVTEIYHTIQTMAYKEQCSGVMVTGGKPPPERKSMDWRPIWGNGGKWIFDYQFMTPNCKKANYSQYASIVYKNPNLDTEYEDGIDNLYEKCNGGALEAFDVIMGYAHLREDPTGLASVDTTITFHNTAKVPIKMEQNSGNGPFLGKLMKRPEYSELEDTTCWVNGQTASFEDGVEIVIPPELRFSDRYGKPVDAFVTVDSVYVVGRMIDFCRGAPMSDKDAIAVPTEENTIVVLTINSASEDMYKLTEGEHYTIAYNYEEYRTPYIVFADNSFLDSARYGSEVPFKVNPRCRYAEHTGKTAGIGTVLPLNKTNAILVKDVYAIVVLETPSITIYDPHTYDGGGGRAMDIAASYVYDVKPLVYTDKPPPMAFNGSLIDPTAGLVDHDPTTTQSFDETPLEQAQRQMDKGGGVSLTLSFLDEDGVTGLSEALYEYMNSGSGVETTYVCGPECNPKLGGTGPSGGIVNNITYSYTDSSSYTISVNEGPWLTGGFGQITNRGTDKQSSNFSTNGTVLADLGNHVHYKVNIDGIGHRIAINGQSNVLRTGDRVSVTIFNNPIED